MNRFFAFELRQQMFECHINARGPYVESGGGFVSLGVCALRFMGTIHWESLAASASSCSYSSAASSASRPSGKPALRIEVADEWGSRSWCIVKYQNQRRIDLPFFTTNNEAHTLGATLGIPAWGLPPAHRCAAFYASEAFEGLREWIAKHPRLARRYAQDQASRCYLPDWYERAIGQTHAATLAPTIAGVQR